MVFPWRLSLSLAKHWITNTLRGNKRFPLVLMLEPTLLCNLSCAGCGRIREYQDILDKILSVDECLSAVEETNAPVVSLTGGEPLLHPDIVQIVKEIIRKKRFIYLCTNGILLKNSLKKFTPNPFLSFVLHLDGLAETHNRLAGKDGVFETAIAAIKEAKKAGFTIQVNTTIYKGVDLKEIEKLFTLLSEIPVNSIMVSPAFGFSTVSDDIFLSRHEIHSVFHHFYEWRNRFRFYNSPIYFDFLMGKRKLECTSWGFPTRNPKGWKSPCYFITDEHYETFKELMEKTPWEKYGPNNDPRCENCMVHYGFEATALNEAGKRFGDLWRIIKWNLFGR